MGTTHQPFSLYAARGRVYCRNRTQKVVDLGTLAQLPEGWCYLLDGNRQSGRGFVTPDEALRDIAAHLRFLWLDGQFTALADARDDAALNLDGATQLDFTLDEMKPGEPAVDASV